MVHRDAHSRRVPLADAHGLQLLQREPAAGAHAAVVLYGWTAHHRAQLVDRTCAGVGGLFGAGDAAGLFLEGLGRVSGFARGLDRDVRMLCVVFC